jgi:hypothetical protein
MRRNVYARVGVASPKGRTRELAHADLAAPDVPPMVELPCQALARGRAGRGSQFMLLPT